MTTSTSNIQRNTRAASWRRERGGAAALVPPHRLESGRRKNGAPVAVDGRHTTDASLERLSACVKSGAPAGAYAEDTAAFGAGS